MCLCEKSVILVLLPDGSKVYGSGYEVKRTTRKSDNTWHSVKQEFQWLLVRRQWKADGELQWKSTRALSLSRVQLCKSMDCSLPGSSVCGLIPARILEQVTVSTPGDLPDPSIKPTPPVSPALAGRFFTTEPPGKPIRWSSLNVPDNGSRSKRFSQCQCIAWRWK